MQIYLMARYQRHPEMQLVAKEIESLGHTVSAEWIWGTHEAQDAQIATGTLSSLEAHFAQIDMHNVRAADCCIGFSEPPRGPSRGGRHVELGMALAWGKRVIIVGGSEHVFHALPQIEHVADVEALYALLQQRGTTAQGEEKTQ